MAEKHCSVDGCARPYYAKGMCQMHYARVARGKTLGPAQPIDRHGYCPERDEYTGDEATCECGAKFRQRTLGEPKRYCSTRCRARANGRNSRARGYQRPEKPCSVDGCEKTSLSLGLCTMHYTRYRKSGDPGEVESRHRPGEWRPTKGGYMIRWLDGVQELQHRVVMEEHIGRPLWQDETPHHKNGDRADNRIENLELWSKAQPAGQRVVDKLVYAREIIARYGDLPSEVID